MYWPSVYKTVDLMLTLVLGGTRSGKSHYAKRCASKSGKQVIYVATATAGDSEMQERITRHQLDRPGNWQTIEEPVQLARILQTESTINNFLLVDCLTLWLSNIMFNQQGEIQQSVFEQQSTALLEVLPGLTGDIVLVSNEVGHGVVAIEQTTRRFVDEAGRLHQNLARICDRVVLITAGLPQILK